MKSLASFIIISLLLLSCSTTKNSVGTDNDRQALEQTSIGIRTAFANGDVPTILSYHDSAIHISLMERASWRKT
jgi:PBP1b-binding outer membrane lipoprotein LpoB